MPLRAIVFALFFASGFCSLLYQVVWLRLAFAHFGIVTPVLSVVLSVFMLGLCVGSWGAGQLAARLVSLGLSPAAAYGAVEILIATGAWVVPGLLGQGGAFLLGYGAASSASYLAMSALVIAVSIFGYAVLMGTTFPLMIAFLRRQAPDDRSAFSFLYVANVVGATLGAALTALVLVEVLGFNGTLSMAAAVNVVIGVIGLRLSPRRGPHTSTAKPASPPLDSARSTEAISIWRWVLLFTTGFTSMAMEVVWTRAFTPVLETTIYAFASLLSVYLLATWLGSSLYRLHLRQGRVWSTDALLGGLVLAGLLPLLVGDPRLAPVPLSVLASIAPISALLGYLTPKLIDEDSGGDPRLAGSAYAVNVLGCILGPLLAGYGLLPWVGVKGSLVLLTVVFTVLFAWRTPRMSRGWGLSLGGAMATALLGATVVSSTFEDPGFYANGVVRRDHTATTVSFGVGRDRRLLVNGVGITSLTPITKFMAHLPAVHLREPPARALVICFGMGTTFRSIVSWGADTTGVELVPGVLNAFGDFFPDAASILAEPGVRVVIDDGRRYLARTDQRFDVITLDPPPPIDAAGSSLLYSVEFYELVRQHLAPTGVLQQWIPGGEPSVVRAVVHTLRSAFPHVRVYVSIHGWGLHLLASATPLARPDPGTATRRMPPRAIGDLVEWFPHVNPVELWREMLLREIPLAALLPGDNEHTLITDDRPFNEYYLLRRWRDRLYALL